MCVVYCLVTPDDRYTYVGATKNLKRRLRQHNGEITGGAKYTRRSKSWRVLFFTEGFKGWREALSFEWHLKHVTKYRRGSSPVNRRWRNVRTLLKRPRWEHISLIDNEKINAPKQNQPSDTTTTMGASMSNYATDCVSKQNEGLSLDDDDDARSVGSALYPGETWGDATRDATSRGNNIATTTDARSIRVEVPPPLTENEN